VRQSPSHLGPGLTLYLHGPSSWASCCHACTCCRRYRMAGPVEDCPGYCQLGLGWLAHPSPSPLLASDSLLTGDQHCRRGSQTSTAWRQCLSLQSNLISCWRSLRASRRFARHPAYPAPSSPSLPPVLLPNSMGEAPTALGAMGLLSPLRGLSRKTDTAGNVLLGRYRRGPLSSSTWPRLLPWSLTILASMGLAAAHSRDDRDAIRWDAPLLENLSTA
jgi:hypothetical protein